MCDALEHLISAKCKVCYCIDVCMMSCDVKALPLTPPFPGMNLSIFGLHFRSILLNSEVEISQYTIANSYVVRCF